MREQITMGTVYKRRAAIVRLTEFAQEILRPLAKTANSIPHFVQPTLLAVHAVALMGSLMVVLCESCALFALPRLDTRKRAMDLSGRAVG